MAFIEWVPALSVGVEEIDEQHRRLFALVNELSEAEGDEETGRALAALTSYAAEHFALEERLFAERRYPGAEEHVREHAAFAAKLRGFAADYAAGGEGLERRLLDYLKAWLTGHISFADRKYRPYLARRGE